MSLLQNKKSVVILISIILLLCITPSIYSEIWYLRYIEPMERTNIGGYALIKDGLLYSVKKPDPLSFTGNLAVINDDGSLALIIWPKVGGGYEYGVRISDHQSKTAYEIYIDDKVQVINKGDYGAIELVESKYEQIEEALNGALDMWNLIEAKK